MSLRVAPGGDAGAHLDALRMHLESHAPWGAQVTVTAGRHRGSRTRSTPPARSTTPPAPRSGRPGAVEPVDIGVGGSIPFIAEFAAAFPAATILVTGVEDPGTQAHSINESLHLGVLEKAATAEALLLEALGSG